MSYTLVSRLLILVLYGILRSLIVRPYLFFHKRVKLNPKIETDFGLR